MRLRRIMSMATCNVCGKRFHALLADAKTNLCAPCFDMVLEKGLKQFSEMLDEWLHTHIAGRIPETGAKNAKQ